MSFGFRRFRGSDRIFTTTAFHQEVLGGATPENINPLLLPAFPDLAYDSWITIGLDGPADASAGESAVSTVASPNQNWTLAFDPGAGQPGGDIIMDDEVGGVWYILAMETRMVFRTRMGACCWRSSPRTES